jgi:hypothetical protein
MCWWSHDRYYDTRGWSEQRWPVGAQQADFRVSDADRNQVIDQLKRHTADGRLTLEEFEERVGETMTARTAGQLRTVLRELPPLQTGAPMVARRGRFPVPLVFVGIFFLLAWGHPVFLLVIPLAFLWFGGFRRGRRRRFEDRDRAPRRLPAERGSGPSWV